MEEEAPDQVVIRGTAEEVAKAVGHLEEAGWSCTDPVEKDGTYESTCSKQGGSEAEGQPQPQI